MVAPLCKVAHVAFSTHRYSEMIEWYVLAFGARVQHRDDHLAFLTYDDEHYRFAFFNLGPAKDGSENRPTMARGLNHLGYSWRNLEELFDTYAWLRSLAIMPMRSIRHGMTLSLYYRDPDGNKLEFQIDLMEATGADEFMRGLAVADNPVGEPFDPEALAARVAQGKPVNDLIFRSDQMESLADLEVLLPL